MQREPHLATVVPPGVGQGAEPDDELDIGELIGTLMAYKWFILTVTALAVGVGLLLAFSATPVYRADALLQVDEKAKASLAVLKDLDPLLGDSTSVAAELEILNSRMVLGRAVARLNLEIVAEPVYLPRIGAAIARRHSATTLRAPLFGLTRYAWGGERIAVARLDVPALRVDEAFTLVAGESGAYRLLDEQGAELFAGVVGAPASGHGITLQLSDLAARAGTEFSLMRLSNEDAINRLRAGFSARERANKSGIIEAALNGPRREMLPQVLDEIVGIYFRQNLDRRATEAENQLKFLETQLPALKSQLDAAESAYNAYRQSRGSVDLTLETEGVLKSLIEVDTEMSKLRQEREELRQSFTAEHPRVMALDSKLKLLGDRRGSFDRGVSRLPDTQQTVLRLKRDVEVSTTLYIGLLSTAQQLRVTKAGTVGEVRIIDPAKVGRLPVEPQRRVIVAGAFGLGLLASLGLVWLLRTLRVVVEDPDTLERRLHLPVFASVPHSKAEHALAERAHKAGRAARGEGPGGLTGRSAAPPEPGPLSLLAVTQPDDDAVESLRSLRTTLHFAMLNAPRRSVLVTGPSQDIGKSFVSKNLAAVLAQAGQRVAIIDADLRKGHIHKEFGIPREGGVSEYVDGTLSLADVVRPTSLANLSIVTTGRLAPNPSELLMHPRFAELLESLEGLFDLLIIDAPPVLAVSDAAIVGRHAGTTLLVARAGRHPVRELEQTVKRLAQAGVAVNGIVFNDLDLSRQRYRYGYAGYVYPYTYKAAAAGRTT